MFLLLHTGLLRVNLVLLNTSSVTENGCPHALSRHICSVYSQTTLAGKQALEVLPSGFEVSFVLLLRPRVLLPLGVLVC